MTMPGKDPAEGSDQMPPPTKGSPRPAKSGPVDKDGQGGLDDPAKTQGKAEGER